MSKNPEIFIAQPGFFLLEAKYSYKTDRPDRLASYPIIAWKIKEWESQQALQNQSSDDVPYRVTPITINGLSAGENFAILCPDGSVTLEFRDSFSSQEDYLSHLQDECEDYELR